MIENAIDKKVKRLGKLTKTIKRKRAVFETFLKSRLSYAAQEISYIFLITRINGFQWYIGF